MKSDLITELEWGDPISNLEDDKLYKYNIDNKGIANFLVFRKVDDKIICCNANYYENNNLKFCTITPTRKDIQYIVIDYKTVENDNIQEFYETLLKKYDEVMQLYHSKEVDNDCIVFETDIPIDDISIKDMSEELNKKYYAIEIKETCSEVVYVREKSIEDAIERVEQLRNDGNISLDYNDWNINSEIREFNKLSLEDDIYNLKNNKEEMDMER